MWTCGATGGWRWPPPPVKNVLVEFILGHFSKAPPNGISWLSHWLESLSKETTSAQSTEKIKILGKEAAQLALGRTQGVRHANLAVIAFESNHSQIRDYE